ncbi:MAG: hypothetical protein H6559_14240 [Lewinellaceae bacterium]|nr:hypothetical protein [Lewinellaceae bacterium]
MREERLIDEIIDKLKLDLSKQTILTEVGSSHYALTPIIALKANAHKVYAWTRDSVYGKGIENIEYCKLLCNKFNVNPNKITFSINERPNSHINDANIITNLGFVRPINKEFLDSCKPNAVISYMCEAWEYREGDVDIEYCKEIGIKVAGTWENHPSIKVFESCGNLILKMCFNAGFEIFQNRILIISEDEFGRVAREIFLKAGADEVYLVAPYSKSKIIQKAWDFILLADYSTKIDFFHNTSPLLLNTGGIVHLSGILNYQELKKAGFFVYPNQDGYAQKMSKTLDFLGPKMVINLHAAGLKVGELLTKNITSPLLQEMT